MGRDFQIGLKKKKKQDSTLSCLLYCAVLNHSVMSDFFWPHRLCSPPGSSVYGDSPGKNIGVGCHALLQGIFPVQGSNPGLLHCRQILYHLSHQGSPSCLQEMNFIYKHKNKLKVEWWRKRYHEKRDDKRVMAKQIF